MAGTITMITVSVAEVIPVRVRPLRYREFFVLAPLRVEGGYTNEFYDSEIFDTLRPYRAYRLRIFPLLRRFRLDSFGVTQCFVYLSFDLPPGEEPASLPEDLARLKHVADEFRRILEGA